MASIIRLDAIDDRRDRERQENLHRLRKLADWYRTFAERTGNPTIWEARLRTAAELEREADRLEEESAPRRERDRPID